MPLQFFSIHNTAKMSESWRYTAESPDCEISEIWCDATDTPKSYGVQFRIFPWRVRLSTGEIRGLYSLQPNDFSGADRTALEKALKNAKELREKCHIGPSSVTEVKTSAWSCC